jgi:hypothetical protein
MYGDAAARGQVDPHLVLSARSVLRKAIGPNHVAWVGLSRKAFSALPLAERREALPKLLEELPRVWAIAPQVGHSLEQLGQHGGGEASLILLVVGHLIDEARSLPDFAATWLLQAFQSGHWTGRGALARLDPSLKPFPVAKRELLLALKGTGHAAEVTTDRADPWHSRALVWVNDSRSRRLSDGHQLGFRSRWYSQFDAIMRSLR